MRSVMLLVGLGACRAVPQGVAVDTAIGRDSAEDSTGGDTDETDHDDTDSGDTSQDGGEETGTTVDTGPWVFPEHPATVETGGKLMGGAGWSTMLQVGGGGDVTGDGMGDILIGVSPGPDDGDLNTYGTTFVTSPPARGSENALLTDVASSTIGSIQRTEGFGRNVAAGDVDGDGQVDLVVADRAYVMEENEYSSSGAVFVFTGPIGPGAVGEEAVSARLSLVCPNDWSYANCYVGASMAVGDANGDAYADIAFSGWIQDMTYGAAIFAGPVSGEVDVIEGALAYSPADSNRLDMSTAPGDGGPLEFECPLHTRWTSAIA